MTTQISVETLSPITHNQIPVITTELLAHLYGTKIKNISDNFLNNTTRFVVGKHFFKIEKNELREFKNRPETIGLVGKNARSLILWTERGAARHAKMLETDQAFRVIHLPVGGVMTMDRTTTGASYGVSAATMIYSFLDSFTHDEWAAIGIMGGLFFGALTWITNVYFQRQRNRILEQQKNGIKDES